MNQVYRLKMTGNISDATLEVNVFDTNTVEPRKDIKELGIVVFDKNGMQLDSHLSLDEIESLINYLTACKTYIKTFNNKIVGRSHG